MRNFNNSRRPSNGPRRDSAERGAAGSNERRGNNFGRKFSGSRKSFGFGKSQEDRPSSYRKDSFGKDSEERRSSYGKSYGRSYGSSNGQSGRSGERPFGKTGGKPFGKSSGKSFDRSFDRSSERPSENSERRYSRNSGGFNKNFDSRRDNDRPRYKSGRNNAAPKPAFTPQDSETDGIRLNKFISNSGICSRREADEYIKAGLVSINGEIVSEMGIKVTESDDVRFNGERLKGESKVYILMNKPKDVVTTVSDPHAETTVIDLIRNKCDKRVFPVGRLDKATTGVLLLTNDGELTEKLTHPSFEKKKIYHVFLDRKFHGDDMRKLVEGITLEDGPIHVDTISYVEENKDQVGVEIHSGRNRIVRRMFEHLGYKVKKLDRVYFAGLTKRKLRRGEWRYLTEKEVSMLMMGAFE